MRRLAWGLIPLIVLAGCASVQTPRERFRVAADAYAAAMETLAEYRSAGLIDDEAAARIEVCRRLARAALDAWHAAIKAGGDPSASIQQFSGALQKLLDEQLKAELENGQRTGAAADEAGAARARVAHAGAGRS